MYLRKVQKSEKIQRNVKVSSQEPRLHPPVWFIPTAGLSASGGHPKVDAVSRPRVAHPETPQGEEHRAAPGARGPQRDVPFPRAGGTRGTLRWTAPRLDDESLRTASPSSGTRCRPRGPGPAGGRRRSGRPVLPMEASSPPTSPQVVFACPLQAWPVNPRSVCFPS